MKFETPQDVWRAVEPALKNHEKAINSIAKHLDDNARTELLMQRTDPVEAIRSAIREEYEQSKNYTNLITGIGYAGFFGLWALTKDLGYTKLHAVAGLCTGISLVFFVGWELYQTAVKGHVLRRVSIALNEKNFEAPATYQREMAALVSRLTGVWPWVYYPSVVFGLTGAGILLFALLLRAVMDVYG